MVKNILILSLMIFCVSCGLNVVQEISNAVSNTSELLVENSVDTSSEFSFVVVPGADKSIYLYEWIFNFKNNNGLNISNCKIDYVEKGAVVTAFDSGNTRCSEFSPSGKVEDVLVSIVVPKPAAVKIDYCVNRKKKGTNEIKSYCDSVEATLPSCSPRSSLTTSFLNSTNNFQNSVFPDSFDWTGINVSGKSVQNIDFSNSVGLTVAMLNSTSAFGLAGNKFPNGFDLTGFNTTGKSLTNLDFSNTTGLTISMINNATDIRGIKLPSGFDLTGLAAGKNLRHIDFTGVIGLTVAMLDGATDFSYAVLPASLNITGIDNSANRFRSADFRLVTGLTQAMLETAGNVQGIKYPTGFDMTGINLAGMNHRGSDFSGVTGLTHSVLEGGANDLTGTILPNNYDLTGFNSTGKYIGIDYTNVLNLAPSILSNAAIISGSKFPDGFDFTGFNATGKYLHSTDYRNTVGLTVAMIQVANLNLAGAKFPNGFDWTGFAAAGTNFTDVDNSGTIGLSVAMLNNLVANGMRGMIFPSMDLTGLNTTGRQIYGADFSRTTGLTAQMLNDASSINSIILPAGMDLTGFNPTGKSIGGIDFSNTTGLTIAMVNNATNLYQVKLPASLDLSGLSVGHESYLSSMDLKNRSDTEFRNLLTKMSSFSYTLFPDKFDFTGVNMAGNNIYNTDYSMAGLVCGP